MWLAVTGATDGIGKAYALKVSIHIFGIKVTEMQVLCEI